MEATTHRLVNGFSRELSFLPDESVYLVVTSPPYWNLKRHKENTDLFATARLLFETVSAEPASLVREDRALYEVRPARKRLE